MRSEVEALRDRNFEFRDATASLHHERQSPRQHALPLHDVSIELLDYIKLIGELRAL
jgi:hypothetical protein